ncbi:reverse transcriptase domain-containing protein [Tanacetum coccineum]
MSCAVKHDYTHSGMTPKAIEELVNQRVKEALAAYEATRAANALKAESQSQNGSDDDNGNGGDGNGENGNGGNENQNENNRGVRPVARESKELKIYSLGSTNLIVKNNDLVAYTQRFQELTMMCTKMVLEEEDRVEKFIRVKNAKNKRRLEVNQRDNRGQQPPFKRQNVGGQNVARAYTVGNNEKRGFAGPFPYCSKCKLHHKGPCTVKCGKCNKVGHMARDCKNAFAVPAAQRALVVNQRVPTCFECGR